MGAVAYKGAAKAEADKSAGQASKAEGEKAKTEAVNETKQQLEGLLENVEALRPRSRTYAS